MGREKGDGNLFYASYNYEELIARDKASLDIFWLRGARKGDKSNFQLACNRDKASLHIFWLRDESLEESDNLPDPDVLAQEIVVPRLAALRTTPSQDPRPARGPRRGVEDLEAALEQFCKIANDLGPREDN